MTLDDIQKLVLAHHRGITKVSAFAQPGSPGVVFINVNHDGSFCSKNTPDGKDSFDVYLLQETIREKLPATIEARYSFYEVREGTDHE